MTSVRAGDVIAGKFQIERILGEGGMGYVVAARHLQLGQMVALKFIRDEVCTTEFKARFLREARNTVRLKSKHVSRVLDVGALDSGSPYMVMEYLEGTDLSDLLQKRGPFPVMEACDYIIQACEAIAEAHGHGIVHRDLKPANLFLTRGSGGEPVIKVLDFGVSKVLEPDEDDPGYSGRREHHDSVVTKATDLLGSPSYMAPEQVVSARDADARSDVWSLGVILFRLISGKAPFAGQSLGDLIQTIMHAPLPNLRALRPDIPAGLELVVWRCFDREREKRPDAIELARLLSPYAGPNATPSLERIAILGPALIRAIPSLPPPAPPAPSTHPSVSNSRKNSWTSPPAASLPPPARKDMSATSFLVWAMVFSVVIASLAVVGVKVLRRPTTGGAGDSPVPTFAPLPPATASETAPAADSVSVSVSVPAFVNAPASATASATASALAGATAIPSASASAKPTARPPATGHGRPRPPTQATGRPTTTAPTATPPATSEIPGTRE